MSLLSSGDRFMISPETYSCMFGKVVCDEGGVALMHFSDGTQSTDFEEPHECWLRILPEETIAYLAGPMRGIEYYNAASFNSAYRLLLDYGYDYVINPVSMDYDFGFDYYDLPKFHDWNSVPIGFSLEMASIRCLQGVSISDEIILLPGWRDSKGSMAEYSLAAWLGKRILEASFYENSKGELEIQLNAIKDYQEKPQNSLSHVLKSYSGRFFRNVFGGQANG
jgi:hypothetical protein